MKSITILNFDKYNKQNKHKTYEKTVVVDKFGLPERLHSMLMPLVSPRLNQFSIHLEQLVWQLCMLSMVERSLMCSMIVVMRNQIVANLMDLNKDHLQLLYMVSFDLVAVMRP